MAVSLATFGSVNTPTYDLNKRLIVKVDGIHHGKYLASLHILQIHTNFSGDSVPKPEVGSRHFKSILFWDRVDRGCKLAYLG